MPIHVQQYNNITSLDGSLLNLTQFPQNNRDSSNYLLLDCQIREEQKAARTLLRSEVATIHRSYFIDYISILIVPS